MLEEMDIEFRDALSVFLKNNPEVDKLYQERLKQKQDEEFQRYKEAFSEETGEILSDSKEIILSDKKEENFFEEDPEEYTNEESDDNESEEDNSDKEEKKIYQKLYREIVKITHPDKVKDDQRNKMYIRATTAYEKNEFLVLVMIASQLNIEWDWNPIMETRVKTTVDGLQKKLVLIEKSVSWLWYNTENDDTKNQVLMVFLRNILQS